MAHPPKLPVFPAEIMLLITEYYFLMTIDDCTAPYLKSTCRTCGGTAACLAYNTDLKRPIRHITLTTQNYLDIFPHTATTMYKSFDTTAMKAGKAIYTLGREREAIYKGKTHEFEHVYLLALSHWTILKHTFESFPWSKYGVKTSSITQGERK